MSRKTILAQQNVPQPGKEQHLIVSWPGTQITIPLTEPIMQLGRVQQGNQIVINHAVISRYHATLKWQNGGYHLIDGQARNGQYRPSTNGLYLKGKRISEHRLKNGDTIHIPDHNENFVTITYFDGTTSTSTFKTVPIQHKLTVGRDAQTTISLDDPLVSRFQFDIKTVHGKGHILRDLDSSNGTFVNGTRVTQTKLNPNDIIQVGSTQLKYDGQHLIPIDLRKQGIKLKAFNVCKKVKVKKSKPTDSGEKILLHNISLAIHPREFVALVGVSGAGKSTLLDALNGSRPADGHVLINGYDLYDNYDAYRQSIGYVPQDDIIHRELTVEEALRYVARLRLPLDTPEQDVQKRINTVLEQVAMLDKRQVLIRQLSGGQRKRVNIAVELIADPSLIFLDEPTSGLDPGLDRKMMFTLRQIANSGRTVVLVTHATSNITDCNLVAFLAVGGRLVFYGPPAEALRFFGVSDFAEIYNKVELEPAQWVELFRASPYHDQYVRQRLGKEPTQQIKRAKGRRKSTHSQGVSKQLRTSMQQLVILMQRYLTILFRDARNLGFLVLQAPLITVMLFLVVEPGLFGLQTSEIGQFGLQDMQKVLFLLACTATWFGLINAIREIVKEIPIYRRERLVNLNIIPYVGSKLIVLLGLGLLQAFIMVMMMQLWVNFNSDGIWAPAFFEIVITMMLISLAATCFGLFLSALLGREDRVMSVMPLFLIPQIVFAGIVFPLNDLPLAETISMVTFSRWGIEALGAITNLDDLYARGSDYNHINSRRDVLLSFDYTHSLGYLLTSWGVLLALSTIALVLTVITLKMQDVN